MYRGYVEDVEHAREPLTSAVKLRNVKTQQLQEMEPGSHQESRVPGFKPRVSGLYVV